MRIVNLKEFRDMPIGTVFMKYEPQIFGELLIKDETWEFDFNYCMLTDCVDSDSSDKDYEILTKAENDSSFSVNLHFNTCIRDGLFEENQLFAVYEKKDTEGLIDRLKETL